MIVFWSQLFVVNRYYEIQWERHRAGVHKENIWDFVDNLSQPLRHEVLLFLHRQLVLKVSSRTSHPRQFLNTKEMCSLDLGWQVPFFANCSINVVLLIIENLTNHLYMPGDYVGMWMLTSTAHSALGTKSQSYTNTACPQVHVSFVYVFIPFKPDVHVCLRQFVVVMLVTVCTSSDEARVTCLCLTRADQRSITHHLTMMALRYDIATTLTSVCLIDGTNRAIQTA